jgi:diguanylate cyclase (GGDEF)-like protein
LTGLFNRRYFRETIARDISSAARRLEPLTILAIDVDHFKRVNDVHGHAIGDQVLVALARTIKKCIRASDIACRFGGEEFVVVLPGASLDVARRRAETLCTTFASTPLAHALGEPVHATISLGVSSLHLGVEEIDAALARADAALYEAKHDGRNRVVIAEADARTSSERPGHAGPPPSS